MEIALMLLHIFKGAAGDPGKQGLPGEMGVKVGVSNTTYSWATARKSV